MDIRQSPQFSQFMQDIHWDVEKIDGQYVYLKKFPIMGYFAKMPRSKFPFNLSLLTQLTKSRKIFKIKIAPNIYNDDINTERCRKELCTYKFKIENDPFNPTTTIHIDLTKSKEELFCQFSEAKRRAVRKAIKNNIIILESDDFHSFIEIRKKQFSPMGFLVVSEMKALWKNFYPKNGKLLLAYDKDIPVAGILLLFYDNIAYYWYASALPIGKKLFAPTLLVWEALKLSKKEECKIFDFEGIYDERFQKAGKSWKGFTKFKEGFGGKKKVFIENFTT